MDSTFTFTSNESETSPRIPLAIALIVLNIRRYDNGVVNYVNVTFIIELCGLADFSTCSDITGMRNFVKAAYQADIIKMYVTLKIQLHYVHSTFPAIQLKEAELISRAFDRQYTCASGAPRNNVKFEEARRQGQDQDSDPQPKDLSLSFILKSLALDYINPKPFQHPTLSLTAMTSLSRKVRSKPNASAGSGNTGNALTTQSSCSLVIENHDLLIHILVRLPVKNLIRSKSVSKKWLSIISNPEFARTFHNRVKISGLFLNQWSDATKAVYEFVPLDKQNVSKPAIGIRKSTKLFGVDIESISIPSGRTLNFLNDRDDVCMKIVHSCNGLICCSYSVIRRKENEASWSSSRETVTQAYYIYNPTTINYKMLPESPFRKDGYRSIRSMLLAFDPLKSPDYEVICFLSNDKDNEQIEIYSSKASSWRLCEAVFEGQLSKSNIASLVMDCIDGVFWNGSLHWISEGCLTTAAYFDIGQGLMKEMPMLPNSSDDDKEEEDDSDTDEDEDTDKWKWDSMSVVYFGENGGHLYLVRRFYPHRKVRFEILQMKADYTGWNVKYRGNFRKLTRQYPELSLRENWIEHDYFGYDLSILRVEEKEESLKMVIRVVDKVVSYDLNNKSFKLIHELPEADRPEMNSPAWNEAHQFVESLASV